MADLAPIYISSGSVNTLTLPGINNAGVLSTSADTTVYLTLKDKNGTVLLGEAVMTPGVAGTWSYTSTAGLFVRGNGPWPISLTIYDQNGKVSGSLLLTKFSSAYDEEV